MLLSCRGQLVSQVPHWRDACWELLCLYIGIHLDFRTWEARQHIHLGLRLDHFQTFECHVCGVVFFHSLSSQTK